MCGLCCKLFLINLSESEYKHGQYITVFDDIEIFDDFGEAELYGANILAQQIDGSCIYLENGKCSIHDHRPQVCRDFFCQDTDPKYALMRADIARARQVDSL